MELNLKNETWAKVNEHYSVSSKGKVKSHSRLVKSGRGTRITPEKLLNVFIKKQTGYPTVAIHKTQINVHVLVANAFLGQKPFKAAQVNHIDSNRTNNDVSNLEWVTPSQNIKHSYDTTKRVSWTKNKFSKENPTSKKIVATNIKTNEKTYFDCGMDAVRQGFRSDSISRACNGKIKTHAGHYWNFQEKGIET